MVKILVVEDQLNIIELIKFNLVKEGWSIDTALDGRTAIDKALLIKPDIILLDLMLPEIDGLEVCRILKSNNETMDIPIIMLSAKSGELDKVLGIELGADDYMTKPFSPRELTARIRARLRKKKNEFRDVTLQGNEIRVNDIIINPEKFVVSIKGVKKDLTLKEFELLNLLVTNRGKVFTREHLLSRVWNYDYSYDTRTVDVHIRYLRKKIEDDPTSPKYIETVRGVGYRFSDGK